MFFSNYSSKTQTVAENWVTKAPSLWTILAYLETVAKIIFFLEINQLSDWVGILWRFMKFFFKQVLKNSAFYLEKQNSFITKKISQEWTGFDIKKTSLVHWPNFQWRLGKTFFLKMYPLLLLAPANFCHSGTPEMYGNVVGCSVWIIELIKLMACKTTVLWFYIRLPYI